MPRAASNLVLVLLLFTLQVVAQDQGPHAWEHLIDSGKYDDAKTLCTSWQASKELAYKVEAEKCLANVELSRKDAQVVHLEGNDTGGGMMYGGYTDEATDAAIAHLDVALQLAPKDESVWKGKLYLLEAAERFEKMAETLEAACSELKYAKVDDWIAYPGELLSNDEAHAGILLLDVLDRHFPNSNEVLGDYAAAYGMLKQFNKAIAYAQRAVALAPNDPIDVWNLGRMYDGAGQTAEADKWLQKALAMQSDAERRCYYAHFIEGKVHDRKRACQMEKADCEQNDRSACVNSASKAAPAAK